MAKKIIYTLVILIVLVYSGIYITRYLIFKRSLPDYSASINILRLKDTVIVYRDSFAMPHVFARNTPDLYRATGYLVAQDRLWQMDLLRRVTLGRLSEIFGKDMLDADILMRSLRISEKSEKLYQEASPALREICQAYADGVNQYIREHWDNLPPEFKLLGYKPEYWKPQHSYNLVGYMAWDLNGCWVAEIVLHKLKARLTSRQWAELVPASDSSLSVIYPPNLTMKTSSEWGSAFLAANDRIQQLGVAIFHGSNNWAVDGKHSVNGKPLLANDMHLGLFAPGIWYQMQQIIPGDLNVTGVMLPGSPFIISGHNQSIAWGMTNVMNDDIDFYQEETNPADSTVYKLDGQWKPFLFKTEKIGLKGGKSITRVLKFTHRGPVISDLKNLRGETVSMHWLGNEWSNEIQTVYSLNRAKNWTEFKKAVSTFVSVSQNVVFADTAGNIGLYCCAGVPLRKGPGWEVLPGNTTDFDWKGWVPFDSLPHYFNPSSGLAVSANNKTASADYPHYISCWYDLPFRYNRILHMLQETPRHDAASFKKIQTDFHSEQVDLYLPEILKLLRGKSFNPEENQALDILRKWDHSMDAHQAAPAIYETFLMEFIQNTFQDEMGDLLYQEFLTDKILVRNAVYRIWSMHGSSFCDDIKTREHETLTDITVKSFTSAIAHLVRDQGNKVQEWQWGDMHQLNLPHYLGSVKILDWIFNMNRGPFPVGGSFHTVEPYSYKYTQPFISTQGASQRHIYVTGNWDDSWTVLPTGISGNPSSPFYCDQTDLYIRKQYKHDWFSESAIIQHARFKTRLIPQK